ncbi:RNA polymerase sigma factor YlaC [Planctomycetes bacterium Poly30]|uniref:RNA polymerase sigma factor YlaC n=1 Tax=Saltatorellus ferox TaxID=2528018 RepID=A0A518EQR4_9BACT|nr:RNA polymerase sigma factor YlaC [Planctomycetes bacterium Poly30]
MTLSDSESPEVTEQLFLRARAGERSALESLFASAGERLQLFVELRMGARLRTEFEPNDVVQETWVAALEGLERFEPRGEGSFGAWLCRIAEHRIVDLGRHGARRKRTPPGQRQPVSRWLEVARTSATGPFSAAARLESHGALTDAVGRLDERDRETLLMRHFEELTLEEIADRTGASPTAVRRRLGRVLGLLGAGLGRSPE